MPRYLMLRYNGHAASASAMSRHVADADFAARRFRAMLISLRYAIFSRYTAAATCCQLMLPIRRCMAPRHYFDARMPCHTNSYREPLMRAMLARCRADAIRDAQQI